MLCKRMEVEIIELNNWYTMMFTGSHIFRQSQIIQTLIRRTSKVLLCAVGIDAVPVIFVKYYSITWIMYCNTKIHLNSENARLLHCGFCGSSVMWKIQCCYSLRWIYMVTVFILTDGFVNIIMHFAFLLAIYSW